MKGAPIEWGFNRSEKSMSCSRFCSQFIVFPAFHRISLPGNIFGILILDMGEGVGEAFFFKLKSNIYIIRIICDLNLFASFIQV